MVIASCQKGAESVRGQLLSHFQGFPGFIQAGSVWLTCEESRIEVEHRKPVGQAGPAFQKSGVNPDRLLQHGYGLKLFLFGANPGGCRCRSEVEIVSARVNFPVAHPGDSAFVTQSQLYFTGDGPGHVTMQIHHVGNIALIHLSPQVPLGAHTDQLGGDAHLIAIPEYRPLDQCVYIELCGDLAHRHGLVFIDQHGSP